MTNSMATPSTMLLLDSLGITGRASASTKSAMVVARKIHNTLLKRTSLPRGA